jgi:hypothetical protein
MLLLLTLSRWEGGLLRRNYIFPRANDLCQRCLRLRFLSYSPDYNLRGGS